MYQCGVGIAGAPQQEDWGGGGYFLFYFHFFVKLIILGGRSIPFTLSIYKEASL